MPLIRNGYAIPTRRRFSGALFSALLAFALFDPSAATAQKRKQIKLTEKHIQGFMGARKDMTKLYDGANPDKPNPNAEVQAEAARKNGFASLDEYDEVSFNNIDDYVRYRSADEEVHRATRTYQEGDRGAQG